jgi:glycine/D-amino acid oxidase-like deaminating enzyme
VIRGTYGPDQPYTKMTARALELWTEHEHRWKKQFMGRIGVLWMAAEGDDQFERGSLPLLKKAGIPYEELTVRELEQRWPQVHWDGVRWGIYEPECGYLLARTSCQAVLEGFLAEGGSYRQASVASQDLDQGVRAGLALSDGSAIAADGYVFACGPWLGKLFPQTIGGRVRATRQDVFFFGTPAGDLRFTEAKIPVWGDHRGQFFYGIPGNQGRGFKLADDTRGSEFDPTSGERMVSPDRYAAARRYLAYRFPALKDAPLLETRVCQYENTPDNHFIIDRHPHGENAWIVGGGSGHGFKHGPAVGEIVAQMVLEGKQPDRRFLLSRLG